MPVEAKPLFRPDVLRTHLAAFELPARVAEHRGQLSRWADLLASGRADQFKEQELLADFLTDFFAGILGYARPADGAGGYTFSREKHVEVDGKFADAVLGRFAKVAGTLRCAVAGPLPTVENDDFVVALEGKGPKDPLDRPFAGRRMSAVDQGYRYAINLPCDFILVTNIGQTRLYHKGSDQHTFERFDTERLADDDAALKRFVFLLGAERVVPAAGKAHFYALLDESHKVGRELTREFYVKYANMRQDAFAELARDNPTVPRHDVLTSTQKLLDRVLFSAFCEDRGLLPVETIRKAYEHRDPYHPRPIWDNFRSLFGAINRGNAALGIHAYNGGLFADDPLLDSLAVSDAVCGHFRDLGSYDYRPPHQAADSAIGGGGLIDVEILGHIFEQSISDLEKLRNELDGLAEPAGAEKHKTRRKKEGAFYTPAFITRYIIEQALGGVLADRFEELRRRHEEMAKSPASAALADPRVYELARLKKTERQALVKFWEAWQDELGAVRILDPACGSGAFLIEAFDQLHAAYEASNDRLGELRGHRTLFDLDKTILENNLYGVDLNEEAIEICRLSLWIKTAERGKPLTSLDHTIRVGNSVVADPHVHPKAFDWREEFAGVFEEGGGFDVVVGNPPYIRQEWLAPYKAYWETEFETYDGVADIFTYFFETGLRLLRHGGRLALITSGSWVRGNFGAPLRKYLTSNAKIESMVDFGEFQPFKDAEMIRPSITILRKAPDRGKMRLFKFLTAGRPPENLSEVIAQSPTMRIDHLGAGAWELDADDVLDLRKKLTAGGKPLHTFSGGILRGVITGLTDVFVISEAHRAEIIQDDPRSADIIRAFAQGTHLRPWYMEVSGEHLLAIKSSANHAWPWSDAGDGAERVFQDTFPAIYAHLAPSRDRAIKRQDQGRFWWELRACAYWDVFDGPKIVWPDISKLPRFSLDSKGHCLGNTVYTVPSGDGYLLGVLSSWATWFFISKTAQPLRLRGDRWQYRLFTQFMDQIPIPEARGANRSAIAALAERASTLGTSRYEVQSHVQRRLCKSFGEAADGTPFGTLNNKATEWWVQSTNELGAALKLSFKLSTNPLKNPRIADEWEPYLAEKRAAVESLTRQLADAEAELNERVYRLFDLTPDEVKLLQREVEH
ncbi:MAG TPA: N-6 DNA methylase [Pirellulales bacterium]|nr:N-6 DNA methylase [Pirellulales bacterium]